MSQLLASSLLLLFVLTSCHAQPPAAEESSASPSTVGGPCEGCEALFEYGDRELSAIDTLPGFQENEPKIVLTGTVFEPDGITPAAGTILYIYHTDREGLYSGGTNSSIWSRRHGRYRGWAKTDEAGRYTFYTFRPAPYPGGQEVEHIHLTVKPPQTNEYYIDEFVFDDDPLLTPSRRERLKNRGGSGILQLTKEGLLWNGERDIVLGLNVPGYAP
ncbi:intradiol ring-cleavage dioxygenase [Lewinella sp. LCG006]|uniref:dioxygenase family protein n=1 Tax=Lewinella sp. LCG006 TaxID=3231911 RepID=UPI003460F69B